MAASNGDTAMSISNPHQPASPNRHTDSTSLPRVFRNQEDFAMADFPRSRNRHQEYSYRLPTPPRIVVPPPTLTSDVPELNVGNANGTDEDIDTSFLSEMDLESNIQKNTLLEWAYERRRQAQMILPWLYLGPLSAAKDVEFLSRENITMALVVRASNNSMKGAIEAARRVCQQVESIEAPTYHTLVSQFPRATRMINQHIARVRKLTAAVSEPRLGKVLVFCESGNEKSAAVVAAYLMETMNNFDHVQAMQICQAQRFCVNFDDTIKIILRSYWDILSAKRAVASSRSDSFHSSTPLSSHLQAPLASTPKLKRSIEDTVDDEDIEMGDGIDPTDILRFGGRDNTPFRDS